MNVLVLNGGSSSTKFSVFVVEVEGGEPHLLLDGELTKIGQKQATLVMSTPAQASHQKLVEGTEAPEGAVAAVLDAVADAAVGKVDAVGYRIVHPGPRIHDHVQITHEVLKELDAAATFAPLHDPGAMTMVRETMRRMPDVPHVACFDTVFHGTMPEEATVYAIPGNLRALGLKRYGFHGLSCESALRQMRRLGSLPPRMVIAHLGSGCSVTAVQDGLSLDTTMGLTPTGGVVMGTRPGDVDPGLLLYLVRQQDATANTVEQMLNHHAGMVALTGLPNDMKAVRVAASNGNAAALLALKVFTRSVCKAIGSFAWLLGGLDAIVFTGGIGEHDAATRAEILQGTDASLDHFLSQTQDAEARRISDSNSKTAVFVVTAQEDLVIALHVKRIVSVNA
ncbi:MAG: acetate/propionate family kinase [Janthinobacterium lividum]